MSTTPKISVEIPGHGTYSCPDYVMDLMIERHLPASPAQLRAIVEERSQESFSDVLGASTFLIILGDWWDAEITNERVARG